MKLEVDINLRLVNEEGKTIPIPKKWCRSTKSRPVPPREVLAHAVEMYTLALKQMIKGFDLPKGLTEAEQVQRARDEEWADILNYTIIEKIMLERKIQS